MAGSKGEVGRLYVAVFANTSKAVTALNRLETQAVDTAAAVNRINSAGKQGSQDTQVRKTSDAYSKMGKSAKGAADGVKKVGESSKKAKVPLGQLQTSMYRLSQSFINLRYGNPIGVFAGLTQSATSFTGAFSGLSGAIGKVVKVFAIASAAVVAFGAAITGVGAIFAKFGLQSAVEIEYLETQYQGLLGSAQKAAEEVSFILEMGKESVVPTEGLLEANRLLLAYGVTADGTRRKMLEFFSVFGSATGLSAARLQDMAYALGQINTQGRANQIDMRQLANAGLNLASVYEEIAVQQGISVAAARELSSEGKLYAEVVIPAVLSQTKKYEAGAAAARETARGILVNLKDIAKINIGRAFDGVLEKLKPLLKWAEEFVESFDFTAVASGIDKALDGITIGLQDVDVSAENAALSVGQGLGGAFRTMGIIAGNVILTLRKAFNWVAQFGEAAELLFLRLERLQLGFERLGVSMGVALGTNSQEALDTLDEKITAVEDSAWEAVGAIDTLEKELSALRDIEIQVDVLVRRRTLAEQSELAFKGAEGMSSKIDGVGAYDYIPPEREGSGGGAGKAKEDAIDAVKEYTKLNTVLEKFNDIVNRPLGSNSAIDKLAFSENSKGLLVGSTSSIVSQYKSVTGAVEEFYSTMIELAPEAEKAGFRQSRSESLIGLKSQFSALYEAAEASERAAQAFSDRTKQEIDSARTRITELGDLYSAEVDMTARYYDNLINNAEKALDDATRAYDAANSKLQDMLSAREQFLSGVQASAFSFVNSMTSVNETLASVTDLDNLGSFSSVQEETTANFKKQMEDRLEIVKQFALDMKSLQSRGLDEGLLRQLVEAGPESGGALASVLADESDAAIAEINALQSDLSSTVGDLQSTLSAAWYDGGIAQQQAFTNRLAVQQQAATEQLAALKALKEQELADLKVSYDARVKEQEDLIANLEAGQSAWQITEKESLEAAAKTTGKIISDIQAGVDKLGKKGDGSLFKLGKAAIDGLILGMDAKKDLAFKKAQSIADRISSTIANAFEIRSPSRVMMGYGENISEGLAIGIENGISRVDMASARLAGAAMPTQQGAPSVKVFIGDRELRDMVDVQISDASGRDLDTVYAGRRDF